MVALSSFARLPMLRPCSSVCCSLMGSVSRVVRAGVGGGRGGRIRCRGAEAGGVRGAAVIARGHPHAVAEAAQRSPGSVQEEGMGMEQVVHSMLNSGGTGSMPG